MGKLLPPVFVVCGSMVCNFVLLTYLHGLRIIYKDTCKYLQDLIYLLLNSASIIYHFYYSYFISLCIFILGILFYCKFISSNQKICHHVLIVVVARYVAHSNMSSKMTFNFFLSYFTKDFYQNVFKHEMYLFG